MAKQIGADRMRQLARLLQKEIPGRGWALLVFTFPGDNDHVKYTNYISNAQRADMILALREQADNLERNQDFKTPEEQ